MKEPILCPIRVSGREYSVLDLVAAIRMDAVNHREQEGKKKQTSSEYRNYGSTAHKEEESAKLSFHATLCEAVKARGRMAESRDAGINVQREDLRFKRAYPVLRADILFVLDVSRSAGFEKRLSFVKSAVMALLTKAYQDRDRVGILTFGDKKAELALPFTRSVEEAAAVLELQKAQGNTPLAMAIRKAVVILKKDRDRSSGTIPMMILLTDGKANFDESGKDPYQQALAAASEFSRGAFHALVVDTDSGAFSMGLAKEIANRMQAYYVEML